MRFNNIPYELYFRVTKCPRWLENILHRRIPVNKCRHENKITDLKKMIQWLKPFDEKVKGNLQWNVQATDVTQYEKPRTTYEGFLAKRFLSYLHLQENWKYGNKLNDTMGKKQQINGECETFYKTTGSFLQVID